LLKKGCELQTTPTTQVSALNESRSHLENSKTGLGSGLEESFASLRRSSATPDLLDSVLPCISSKPSSAGSSSPRLRRPPTKESRSVSICETDVSVITTCYFESSDVCSLGLQPGSRVPSELEIYQAI